MAAAPDWLATLAETVGRAGVPELTRTPVAPQDARAAAVLMLLAGTGFDDGDVLLLERAATLRSHSGQVAFPGGAVDPGDDGPVGAALREAQEETGLDPAGVDPLVVLPELFLPPSGFRVRPVLAHWREPSPVAAVDLAESARVARVGLRELVDPANRFRVRHSSGFVGPAFSVDGLLVWGFTGGLVASLLRTAGWEQPWDAGDVRDLDGAVAAARGRAVAAARGSVDR
jgi:8-oxo-dGTP pyrophosphatase MutT (NUDIX family)